MRTDLFDFDLPEGKVVLDDRGEPKAIVQSRRDPGIRQALLEMVEQACPNPEIKNDYYIICLVEELRSPE